MPALSWVEREAVDPDRMYVAMASRLPLRRYRWVPGFLRDNMRIRKQLAGAEGLVGYALNAQLIRKTFWTLSVWTDDASVHAFARAEPHAAILRRLRPRVSDTRFEFFTVRGDELPLTWDQTVARLR